MKPRKDGAPELCGWTYRRIDRLPTAAGVEAARLQSLLLHSGHGKRASHSFFHLCNHSGGSERTGGAIASSGATGWNCSACRAWARADCRSHSGDSGGAGAEPRGVGHQRGDDRWATGVRTERGPAVYACVECEADDHGCGVRTVAGGHADVDDECGGQRRCGCRGRAARQSDVDGSGRSSTISARQYPYEPPVTNVPAKPGVAEGPTAKSFAPEPGSGLGECGGRKRQPANRMR